METCFWYGKGDIANEKFRFLHLEVLFGGDLKQYYTTSNTTIQDNTTSDTTIPQFYSTTQYNTMKYHNTSNIISNTILAQVLMGNTRVSTNQL